MMRKQSPEKHTSLYLNNKITQIAKRELVKQIIIHISQKYANTIMKAATLTNLLLLAFLCSFSQQPSSLIYVDATKTIGDMKPFWPFFGYDECNYTTRADGKKLLSELRALSSVPVYIRTHNLLTSK